MTDTLSQFFADLVERKPELIKILDDEKARLARSYQRDCPWGNCEVSIDPWDNTIVSTIGIIGCGCDFHPGWRSKYYDGLPKPGWPAKAVGRHGGRIARSRRKVNEHQHWLDEISKEYSHAPQDEVVVRD